MMAQEYDNVSDEELIVLLRDGETQITDYIIEKYKDLVRRKTKSMYILGADHDDLLQEGMIGLIKAVRNFDLSLEKSFQSFAELCVSRQMYSAIQASRRQKHFPLNTYVSLYESGDGHGEEKNLPLIDTIEPGVENNPETLYFGKEYTQAFIRQLEQKLSELENKVLYLHLTGADYRTIAKILDKTPKAIDNALQRIRSKAGQLLK